MNEDDAADPGDDADRRRAQAQLLEREQEPDRAEDAPQRGEQHLGEREGAQERVVPDESEAVADLVEDRLAILGEGRRRLLVADARGAGPPRPGTRPHRSRP